MSNGRFSGVMDAQLEVSAHRGEAVLDDRSSDAADAEVSESLGEAVREGGSSDAVDVEREVEVPEHPDKAASKRGFADLSDAEVDALEELGEEIATLAAHIHAATHRLLLLIAEFDRRNGWLPGGFRSCSHWLAFRTGIDLGAAREKVRAARALEALPGISTAMERGELSFAKVRALTRVATPESEGELLAFARDVTAAELERTVRGYRLLGRLDEAALERERHRSRFFSVFPEDGMYVVRGRLDPEVGAALMRAIEAASDALYRTDDLEVEETEPAQRRADAVGLVAERALSAGLLSARGEEPEALDEEGEGEPEGEREGAHGSVSQPEIAAETWEGNGEAETWEGNGEAATWEGNGEAATWNGGGEGEAGEAEIRASARGRRPAGDSAAVAGPAEAGEGTAALVSRSEIAAETWEGGGEGQGGQAEARSSAGGRRPPNASEAANTHGGGDCGRAAPVSQSEIAAETCGRRRREPVSGSRAERYQIVIHVEPATLGDGAEPGRSELEDGTRLSAETSRRLACDASVVRLVRAADGSVLDVGRRTRTIPPALRRALEARDRGCCFPGCGSKFTDAHHIVHWADGGETKLSNLILLCRLFRYRNNLHYSDSRIIPTPGRAGLGE